MSCPRLLSTWVKAPVFRAKRLVVASACLPYVNEAVFKEISKGASVVLACPEAEPAMHYGKLASAIRSSEPEEVWVVTIDGSPHCVALQAAANEAEYILGRRINKRHFVVVDGERVVEIEADAVRLARYLSLVDKLLKDNRKFVEEELSRHSLEYKRAREAAPSPEAAR